MILLILYDIRPPPSWHRPGAKDWWHLPSIWIAQKEETQNLHIWNWSPCQGLSAEYGLQKRGPWIYFIIKKHTNWFIQTCSLNLMMKVQCTRFLFKRRGPWTLIFILRGLLNRYEFQTFSKLFIYISSIGKNFFCKKNVWEKAIYKNSKTIYQKSPLPPLSKASIHAWRTADGANF